MSNSLDPDQARHFVGPDLGLNCLQKLSTDEISRQRVKVLFFLFVDFFFKEEIVHVVTPSSFVRPHTNF